MATVVVSPLTTKSPPTVTLPVVVAVANVTFASVVRSWFTTLVSSTVNVFEAALNVSVPSLPSPIVKLSLRVIERSAPAAFIVTLLFCVVKSPAVVKAPPIVTMFPPILAFACTVCNLPNDPVDVALALI